MIILISSALSSAIFFVIIIFLVIYFISNSSYKSTIPINIVSTTNTVTDTNINNSTSVGIKDLKLKYISGNDYVIRGYIQEDMIFDIASSLRSKLINRLILVTAETPVINYEYTIKYPDGVIKYMTSDNNLMLDILLVALPFSTEITETKLSGKDPVKYIVKDNEDLKNALRLKL